MKFKIGDLVCRKPEHTFHEAQKECGVVTGLLLGDLIRVSWSQTRTECVCPAHKLELARKSDERTSV